MKCKQTYNANSSGFCRWNSLGECLFPENCGYQVPEIVNGVCPVCGNIMEVKDGSSRVDSNSADSESSYDSNPIKD